MPDVGSLPAWVSALVAIAALVVTLLTQTSKGESKAPPKRLSVLLEDAAGVEDRLNQGTELEQELTRALLRSITSRAAAFAHPLTPIWILGFGLAYVLMQATFSMLNGNEDQARVEMVLFGTYVFLCCVIVLWILGKRRKYVQLHLPLGAFRTPVLQALASKARDTHRTRLDKSLAKWEKKNRPATPPPPVPTPAKAQVPHLEGATSQRASGGQRVGFPASRRAWARPRRVRQESLQPVRGSSRWP